MLNQKNGSVLTVKAFKGLGDVEQRNVAGLNTTMKRSNGDAQDALSRRYRKRMKGYGRQRRQHARSATQNRLYRHHNRKERSSYQIVGEPKVQTGLPSEQISG